MTEKAIFDLFTSNTSIGITSGIVMGCAGLLLTIPIHAFIKLISYSGNV